MPWLAWIPPLVWMGVLFWFSTSDWSADRTGELAGPLLRLLEGWITTAQARALHAIGRKVGHVVGYAALAFLWFRAFTRTGAARVRVAAALAVAISLAWAAVDEAHQATQPGRGGSPVDVAIDGSGALLAVLAAAAGLRRSLDAAVGILLWVAAAGGAAVLAVNLLTGAPTGILWLTVPIASAGLFLRHRLRS
jgi:VanZ family protein